MVSDSDGKHFPWLAISQRTLSLFSIVVTKHQKGQHYLCVKLIIFQRYGDHHEIQLIEGPTTKSATFKVKMNDSFYPQGT